MTLHSTAAPSSEQRTERESSGPERRENSTPRIRQTAKALTIALAMVFGLGLSELALRLIWHNPYRFESPDHMLKLSMNHRSTDHTIDRALLDSNTPRVKLRTDARSYVLPSFQYADPDATVAFLGGSTTECMAVREDLRFPALVSTLLAEQGVRVNTLNGARSGNTLHDSLNVLLNHVVIDRPDLVVLMHASNDVGVLVRDGDYRSRVGRPAAMVDLGRWSFQMVSSNLYLAALTRHAATASAIRPEDAEGDWRRDRSLIDKLSVAQQAEYRHRLKAFVHISRDFGIEPVLMTEPFSDGTNSLTPDWLDVTGQDRFNTIIREVGADEEVLVIDLVSHLQRVPGWNEPMKLFYDAIHVTDRGSRIYAEHIAEQLLPAIIERRN